MSSTNYDLDHLYDFMYDYQYGDWEKIDITIAEDHELINAIIGHDAQLDSCFNQYSGQINQPVHVAVSSYNTTNSDYSEINTTFYPIHLAAIVENDEAMELLKANNVDINVNINFVETEQKTIGTGPYSYTDITTTVGVVSAGELIIEGYYHDDAQVEVLGELFDYGLDLNQFTPEMMDGFFYSADLDHWFIGDYNFHWNSNYEEMIELILANTPSYDWSECSIYTKYAIKDYLENKTVDELPAPDQNVLYLEPTLQDLINHNFEDFTTKTPSATNMPYEVFWRLFDYLDADHVTITFNGENCTKEAFSYDLMTDYFNQIYSEGDVTLDVNGCNHLMGYIFSSSIDADYLDIFYTYPEDINSPISYNISYKAPSDAEYVDITLTGNLLHLAALEADYTMTKLFLQNGGDVNAPVHIEGTIQTPIGIIDGELHLAKDVINFDLNIAECLIGGSSTYNNVEQINTLNLLFEHDLDLSNMSPEQMDYLFESFSPFNNHGLQNMALIYKNTPEYNWSSCDEWTKLKLEKTIDYLNSTQIEDKVLSENDILDRDTLAASLDGGEFSQIEGNGTHSIDFTLNAIPLSHDMPDITTDMSAVI